MLKTSESRRLFAEACTVLPGGVDSPVRAFRAVGGTPLFVRRAFGATIEDADGNRLLDYVMSWGPLIHGHAPKGLVTAIAAAAARGTSFGAPSALEHALGARVRDLMPSMERVRFVSSGTEAAMSVLRLARAYTKRDKIVKFEGCYHGHADAYLVKAGSGATTFGVPTSPGVPASVSADTLVADYNDLGSVDALFAAHRDIAALVVEPIAGNMGLVPPADGFLHGLRERCSRHGALLVFDEVISGFRAAAGGAQTVYGVRPDLTCLGKIIGGGLPVGAYGGAAAIMDLVAPAGPVYQAGTLSGNPVAMTAGAWALGKLTPRLYRDLAKRGTALAVGFAAAARDAGVPLQVNGFGSLLTPFFTAEPVRDYRSAIAADTNAYGAFFRGMLSRGIYPPPSQFEAWFLSSAHTDLDIERTIDAAHGAMKEVARQQQARPKTLAQRTAKAARTKRPKAVAVSAGTARSTAATGRKRR
jgi:glutamate-1-semialdehyde 2,1-aminomutase